MIGRRNVDQWSRALVTSLNLYWWRATPLPNEHTTVDVPSAYRRRASEKARESRGQLQM